MCIWTVRTRLFPPPTIALKISNAAVRQIVYSLVNSPYLRHMKSEKERVALITIFFLSFAPHFVYRAILFIRNYLYQAEPRPFHKSTTTLYRLYKQIQCWFHGQCRANSAHKISHHVAVKQVVYVQPLLRILEEWIILSREWNPTRKTITVSVYHRIEIQCVLHSQRPTFASHSRTSPLDVMLLKQSVTMCMSPVNDASYTTRRLNRCTSAQQNDIYMYIYIYAYYILSVCIHVEVISQIHHSNYSGMCLFSLLLIS